MFQRATGRMKCTSRVSVAAPRCRVTIPVTICDPATRIVSQAAYVRSPTCAMTAPISACCLRIVHRQYLHVCLSISMNRNTVCQWTNC